MAAREDGTGQGGSAPHSESSVRKTPNHATGRPQRKYPQGSPRRGEDEIPNRTDPTATNHANGQPTMTATCICGKLCKNQRGLKIHMAKMKCRDKEQEEQRTGTSPGETQEEPGQ